MAEAVVRVEGASKRFGPPGRGVAAVVDLSLAVERGSVVAILGANGAGKTTTMFLLLGLLRPDAGTVSVLGAPAGDPAARRQLGFLSEIFHTYPHHTARAALRFYAALSGFAPPDLEARIERRLVRLGLGPAMDRRVGTFSKGMVQRLGLAQALLHEPELLILDEPSTGLDPEGRALVGDILLEEKARGASLLLSSHVLSDVERTCDRVIVMQAGTVVLSEDVAALREESDGWEVEVAGWDPALAPRLAHTGAAIVRQDDATALLGCAAERKKALLRLLTELPVDIGTVRPRRRRTLADLWAEHGRRAGDG